MKQLNEIFQNWSDTLEDSPVILATWKAIETELELLQNVKMQDLIFSYSDIFPVKTARFANVAFSNGSLLEGFLKRIEKNKKQKEQKSMKDCVK